VGATVAFAVASSAVHAATTPSNAPDRHAAGFWPNGAQLAVSVSLMFERKRSADLGQAWYQAQLIHDRRVGSAGTSDGENRVKMRRSGALALFLIVSL
jgi:hypothetical protein